jgi:hypothetical protein
LPLPLPLPQRHVSIGDVVCQRTTYAFTVNGNVDVMPFRSGLGAGMVNDAKKTRTRAPQQRTRREAGEEEEEGGRAMDGKGRRATSLPGRGSFMLNLDGRLRVIEQGALC